MRGQILTVLVISLVIGSNPSPAQSPSGPNARELFEKGMNALEGSNATRSSINAIEYIRRSAELGFAPAQVVLGYFYETGRATPPDLREAFEWYKKAAQQDDSLAQWQVGRLLYTGFAPTRDLNEARNWLDKSAENGDPFAQYLLGRIALERNDYVQSAQRFKQAAEQGLPQAQQRLASLLRDGQGVPQNKFDAYVWLLMSEEAGTRSIATDLQTLEAELGITQTEQAKAKARQLETSMTRRVVAHGCTGWRGEFDAIPFAPPPDLQRFCR